MKKHWRHATGFGFLLWLGTWFIDGLFSSRRKTRIVRRFANAPWPDSIWVAVGERWVCMTYDATMQHVRISDFPISYN